MSLTRTDEQILLQSNDTPIPLYYWVKLRDFGNGVILPDGDETTGQAAASDPYVAMLADDGQVWRWQLKSNLVDSALVLTHQITVSPDQTESAVESLSMKLAGTSYKVVVKVVPDGEGNGVPGLYCSVLNEDSIKARLLNRIESNFAPMISGTNPTPKGFVRRVSREMDLLAWSDSLPALMIYDGDEEIMDEDERGITVQFPIMLKLCWSDNRNLSTKKDELVPVVQKIMENDLQLGGLANWVKGGEEEPFINEVGKPQGGALVHYVVEYRRMRGDPYATY